MPCLFHEPVGDGTGLLQPIKAGICSLPLVAILTVSRVQDVVNNLERQANSVTICFNAGEMRFRSLAKIRPNPNRNADQSGRLRTMNRFQLFTTYRNTLTLQI